jgi:uncharacterized protein YciI
MKLDAYTAVFLRRPSNPPDLPEAELDELQARHQAFQRSMRQAGHQLLAGPFVDQPDPSLRGIAIYRTSIEETARLANQDPSVQAGRLVLEIFTWLMPAGLLGDRPAYRLDED